MQDDSQAPGTALHHLPGNVDHLGEPLAQTLQQPRSSGHRIPQEPLHRVTPDLADHEDLKVFHVHVEDPRRADPESLEHAVRLGGVRALGERESVGGDIGVESDSVRLAPTALTVRVAEALALRFR